MGKRSSKIPMMKAEHGLSLRDLAAPLFRRKRLLIITLACVFAAVSPIGLLLFYKFRSVMAVLVNRERVDSLVSTEEINSEAELLLSQDILEKVVVANHLQDHNASLSDSFLHKEETYRIAEAVKILAHEIKVRPSSKGNIIDVSYSSSDPKRSYAVLHSLADLYLTKHAAVHRAPGSSDFFSTETQQYKTALDTSEYRLRSFLQTPGGAAPDVDAQLGNSIGQLHTTQQLIAGDEKRIASDQEQLTVTPQRSVTQRVAVPQSILLQQLGASLLSAETKRTQLLSKYGSSDPQVQEAEQELAQTRAALERAEKNKLVTEDTNADPTYELLRQDLAKTQADLAAQRASLAANRVSIATLQAQMIKLKEKNLDQDDLMREQKTNETNYVLYLTKREQERASDAVNKARLENVAIAIPPSIPVLPELGFTSVLLLSLVLAAFISIGAVYVADYFDSSFHKPAEVMNTLGIPVVVGIPTRTA